MKLDMGLTQIFVSYDYSIITRQDKPDRLLGDDINERRKTEAGELAVRANLASREDDSLVPGDVL